MILAVSDRIWLHSAIVLALTVVASGIAFALYGVDKAAARRSSRRISENTLHLWSLLGGWPGAFLAQRVFRHKTSKLSFQIVFWLTVLLNVSAVAWTFWPGSTAVLQNWFGTETSGR